MKKICSIIVFCFILAAVYAAPARRGWQTRTLTDGTTIELQLQGDEFYHYYQTRDGRMAVPTDQGFVLSSSPLPTPAQAAERREAARAQRAPQGVGSPTPYPRILVILVSYTDLAIQSKNTAEAIDGLFNQTGYSYNGATGSARDYFIAQSDSQYMPQFDVVGPVTLPNNRKYYGENSSGDTDRRAGEMIKDACKAVDNIVDFSLYDSDNNGTVDIVYVVYAGIGANDQDGEKDAIWPHMSYTSGLTLDGKSIYYYACSGEIDGVTKDRTGIGPICHEFGHAIGMPDYYSTGSSKAYIVCEWSAMDYGMYNNDANTPPNYSIFDKQYMGWATAKELKSGKQANLSLTTDYSSGYKMAAGDATYYIENRQPQGWDIGLPGHGMLLWQVKYDQSAWSANHVNQNNTSPRYSILSAASGLMTDGGKIWSTAADPFPGSQNVTSWTKYEGFALTDITEANGQILLKLNGGKTTCTYEILPEHCVAPDDGILAYGNTLSLTILPENGYTLDDEDCWAVEMGEENPILVYGEDFTYDAQTGEFRIENVTDDIVIIVEAKEDTGTALDGVKTQNSKAASRKILRNGQLIILHNGVEYNAHGIQLNNTK